LFPQVSRSMLCHRFVGAAMAEQCKSKQRARCRIINGDAAEKELMCLVTAMKAALGDPGIFVSQSQINDWIQVWQRRFPSPCLRSNVRGY
jgi:hypothetical protein